jgi:hypothetical protein
VLGQPACIFRFSESMSPFSGWGYDRIEYAVHPCREYLSTAVTGPIRDLMERRSGVEAALVAAEAEVDKSVDALSLAEAKIEGRDGGFDEAATGVLTAAARQIDDAARTRAADRICRERGDELDDRLTELRPWTGDRNALCAAPVPTQDQLRHWASIEADFSLEIASRQGEQDRLVTEAGRLDARIEALGGVVGVVSDKDAGEARACVYRQLKRGRSGDEVRPGWCVNRSHRFAEPGEKPAHPC